MATKAPAKTATLDSFDIAEALRDINKAGKKIKLSTPEQSWQKKCRAILIRVLIRGWETRDVLEFLESKGVPLGKQESTRLRTVQRWMAKTRPEIFLPKLPDGCRMANPGYQEALRRWNAVNPDPSDAQLCEGWQANPVDYSDINFHSLTDPFEPRTRKFTEAKPKASETPTNLVESKIIPPPSLSPEVRQEITDDAAGTELPFKEKMRRTSEAASKGEPVLVPKTKENKFHVAKPIANRT